MHSSIHLDVEEWLAHLATQLGWNMYFYLEKHIDFYAFIDNIYTSLCQGCYGICCR